MASEVTIERRYHIQFTQMWKATCVSPVTGETITIYADDIDEAKQRVDLAIVTEAHARGLTVAGRTTVDPVCPRCGERTYVSPRTGRTCVRNECGWRERE